MDSIVFKSSGYSNYKNNLLMGYILAMMLLYHYSLMLLTVKTLMRKLSHLYSVTAAIVGVKLTRAIAGTERLMV